jgi:hypothetical protein
MESSVNAGNHHSRNSSSFGEEPIIARLAGLYARLLMALAILLFTLSLLLHVSVLIGPRKPLSGFGVLLFVITIAAGNTATAFQKNRMSWKNEIRNCPVWMRGVFYSLAIYAALAACLQIFILPSGNTLSENASAVSAIPLSLNAFSACVLYSVIWSGTVDKPELARRARKSLMMGLMSIAVLYLFYLAYLHHPWAE